MISSFAETEFDEVDAWLLQLAKRLLGSSPPEIGPLSTLDIGGGLTIQSWMVALTDRGRIRDAFLASLPNLIEGFGRPIGVERFRGDDPRRLPQLNRAELQAEANEQFRNLQQFLLSE